MRRLFSKDAGRVRLVKIQKVFAAEVLDSRGTPTVSATVVLSDGSVGVANGAIRRLDRQV